MKIFDYVSLWVVAIPVVIGITLFIWWVKSVIWLFDCDFVSPYKCEVIRWVSIVVAPVGWVAWYFDIDSK